MTKKQNSKKVQSIAVKALTVFVLAGFLGALTTTPAAAADHRGPPRGGHHRGWDDHARHNADWYRGHPDYYPGYVAAPPVAVYAPPPSPGINLVLPIHIR